MARKEKHDSKTSYLALFESRVTFRQAASKQPPIAWIPLESLRPLARMPVIYKQVEAFSSHVIYPNQKEAEVLK